MTGNNGKTKAETNNTNPHPDFAPSGASPRLSPTKAQTVYQYVEGLSAAAVASLEWPSILISN
jgi:hypothetical protein